MKYGDIVNKLIKLVTKRLLEAVVAVLIVLLFFSVFLTVLNVMFPVGEGLKAMIDRDVRGIESTTATSTRDLLLTRGNTESELLKTKGVAAVLSKTYKTVRSKRSSSVAWRDAKQGMPLFEYDAVKTSKRSRAVIKFDEESYLHMGPDSLIIIKRLEEDFLFREKRSFFIATDGEFQGKFFGSKEKPAYVEITTPNGVARVRTRDVKEGPAEFKVSVNPDKSSTFTVYNGTAYVEAQGTKVKLEENQRTIVEIDGIPEEPRDLPEPVLLALPPDSYRYYYRDLPPKIVFKWKARTGAHGYRFVLAGDPFFEDVLVDERVSDNSFALGNLKKGDYFWRVSTIESWSEGVYSETRKINVVRDKEPPSLVVQYPDDTVFGSKFVLEGTTEPGARIFVKGIPIGTSSSGSFRYAMNLQHGINVIVVEAVDEAGNVTYSSKMVNGKF
jgi:hypothetical protein